jgi:hypothetical protein
MIFTRSMPGRMLVDGCQFQMQGREAHGPLRVLSFVSISNFTKTFNNNGAHIAQSACAMTGEYFSLVNILVYLIRLHKTRDTSILTERQTPMKFLPLILAVNRLQSTTD